MPRVRRGRSTARNNPTAGRTRNRETLPSVTVNNVNMLWNYNQEKNETDGFESPRHLVLRRGFSFDFIIQVSNHEHLIEELVKVEFRRGYRARLSRGTLFQAVCGTKSQRHYQWKMEVISSNNGEVRYRVHTPCDVPVGSYQCHIRVPVSKNKSKGESVWEDSKQVVFLFNPWNKDDDVYISNDKERDEYINNETGLIWAGTARRTFTWPWNFAQFEVTALEAVLYMLDKWRLGPDARRSPVHVTRCLANMVNHNDSDGGVLVGLWSANDDDYADGTDPTSWSGSEAILKEYMTTKKPVKYAQCWVFGGTLTTTLRTIGIPARPVTNFESAHDGDFNRAIDFYFDRNDKMIEEKSSDSIWNYHVWTEAWMTRPDLDGEYGGWQAVDATPQELSPHSRTMVVGPASIQAIKDGKDLKYDNEFVIGEVNADIHHHVERSDGSFALVSKNKTLVGRHISTKSVGRMSRKDVTSHYKYPEGSAAERAALLGGQDGEPKGAVDFEAQLVSEGKLGEDLKFEVTGKIKSKITGDIRVTAVFESITYTGIVGKEIKKMKSVIKPNDKESVEATFVLQAKDYLKYLGEQPLVSGTFLAYIDEPEQAWVHKLPINLELPDLLIDINGKGNDVKLKSGTSAPVKVTLTNPLNKTLNNVSYHIEGSGLVAPHVIKSNNIPAKGSSTISFTITTRPVSRVGERNNLTLIVTAKSSQLKGIMGTASVEVTP